MSGYQKRNRFRLIWNEPMGREECPYAFRWAFETPIGSIRLHHWLSSDDPRHFHDHPWWFITCVMSGGYTDTTPNGEEVMKPGRCRFRPPHHKHTVIVNPGGCWTVLLTGPHVRYWGFWIRDKFMKSNKYFLENGHHPCE